jgi:hypothetical protein
VVCLAGNENHAYELLSPYRLEARALAVAARCVGGKQQRTCFTFARKTHSSTATSANAAITFLLMNNWEPAFDEAELVDVVLSVAAGITGKPRLIEISASR